MFSTQRLTKCSVALVETHSSPDGSERKENPDLNPLLQRSWITLLTRGQPEVTDTFLASRCEATDATTVALRRRCVTPSGEKLPMQWTRRSCGEKP
jgi:hypothetical protein